MKYSLDRAATLEEEAVYILREGVAQLDRPVLLFSGGKDSAVLLHVAQKAFSPARLPFPVLHIDTGHNFPEAIAFRDRRISEVGARLMVRTVQDSIDRGRVADPGPTGSRNQLQTVTLLDAIAELGFDCVFSGARRDEERSRAKERTFSFRDRFGRWDPKHQRPEFWSLYNCLLGPGEHVRAFPMSNWTELDVWRYVERERLELPSLYFSHEREVYVGPRGMLVPTSAVVAPTGESFRARVRFRTVGDMTCTAAIASTAEDVGAVIAELSDTPISERGATRIDDTYSEASMEDRKRLGYF